MNPAPIEPEPTPETPPVEPQAVEPASPEQTQPTPEQTPTEGAVEPQPTPEVPVESVDPETERTNKFGVPKVRKKQKGKHSYSIEYEGDTVDIDIETPHGGTTRDVTIKRPGYAPKQVTIDARSYDKAANQALSELESTWKKLVVETPEPEATTTPETTASKDGIIGYTLDAFEKDHAGAISQNENLRQTLQHRRQDIEEGLHEGDLETRRRFIVDRVINGISRFDESRAFFDGGYANSLLGSVGLELIPVEIGKTAVDSRTQEIQASRNEPNMLNGAVAQISTYGVRDLETGKIVQKPVVTRAENNNPNATQEVDTTPNQSALEAWRKQKDIDAQQTTPDATPAQTTTDSAPDAGRVIQIPTQDGSLEYYHQDADNTGDVTLMQTKKTATLDPKTLGARILSENKEVASQISLYINEPTREGAQALQQSLEQQYGKAAANKWRMIEGWRRAKQGKTEVYSLRAEREGFKSMRGEIFVAPNERMTDVLERRVGTIQWIPNPDHVRPKMSPVTKAKQVTKQILKDAHVAYRKAFPVQFEEGVVVDQAPTEEHIVADQKVSSELLGISQSLELGKPMTFIGRKVRSIHEMIAISQLARDSRVETGYTLYADANGVVVSQDIVGSGNVGSVEFPSGYQNTVAQKIKDNPDIAKVYMFHQHPSGISTPSFDDFKASRSRKRCIRG